MKNFFYVFLILFAACANKPSQKDETVDSQPQLSHNAEFQSLLDSAKLEGAILIFDPGSNMYVSNDFSHAKTGFLPASTYKVPNSIIALETGVVENDSTLFKWDGEPRSLKMWETDMIFREAFQRSCVPCYQQIAREVGVMRMREMLDKLAYGNMVVDSSSIDLFWLQGPSRISQFEQIDFIQRLYQQELPISQRTMDLMKKIMFIEEKPGYRIYGKTGWSIRDGFNNGWFVGYVEKGEQVYYFATNVSPGEGFDMDQFAPIRTLVTKEALRELDII